MAFDKIKNFSGLKDLSSLGIANIAGSGISAIFWFYLASLLGEESYGEISYFIAIGVIAGVFSSIGSGYTTTVYTAKNVNIMPVLSVLSITISAIAAAIVYILFQNIAVSLYVIGYVIFNIVQAEILGQKKYQTYSKITILQKILLVSLAIPIYFVMDSFGIILGLALSFFPFLFIVIRKIQQNGIDFSVLRSRSGFLMNSYGIDISKSFTGNIDKLIIAPMLGFALLGNYYLGIQFLMLLSILPGIVLQYTLPQDASGTLNSKLKKITVLVSLIFAMIGIFLAPIIIPYLFPEYEESIIIIQIISLAIIPRSISYILVSKFLGIEKSKFVMVGMLIYLATQIPLILVLGDLYGIYGIATSLVIAETIQALFLFIINRVNNNQKR
ncbi:MAG: lipopolysaccharide biosynthesis protein [Candidatus Thorarchaeota archaeon]